MQERKRLLSALQKCHKFRTGKCMAVVWLLSVGRAIERSQVRLLATSLPGYDAGQVPRDLDTVLCSLWTSALDALSTNISHNDSRCQLTTDLFCQWQTTHCAFDSSADWAIGMSASCKPRVQLFADTGDGWPHCALRYH